MLCDHFRLSYFQQYLSNATAAVEEDGVSLKGYFAWSLLDNFEVCLRGDEGSWGVREICSVAGQPEACSLAQAQ